MNVLLLGFGLAGESFHAPLLAATPVLRVGGVVTSRPERQTAAQSRFPAARAYATAEEAFRDPFDLAIVATPEATHVPLARQALQHGCQVVIDKPLALSSQEAKEIVGDERLTVFQNRRWDGDFLTVQRVLPQLGKVHRFESAMERWRPQGMREWKAQSPGGALFDLGSHLVDQALVLFGAPQRVYGEVRQVGAHPGANNEVFLALWQGDVVSHLRMSLLSRQEGPRFHVLGSEGSYLKYGTDVQEGQSRGGMEVADPAWGVEPEGDWGKLNGEPVPTEVGRYQEFYRELAAGRRPVDPADSLLGLRVLEAARESSQTGQIVPFSAL